MWQFLSQPRLETEAVFGDTAIVYRLMIILAEPHVECEKVFSYNKQRSPPLLETIVEKPQIHIQHHSKKNCESHSASSDLKSEDRNAFLRNYYVSVLSGDFHLPSNV